MFSAERLLRSKKSSVKFLANASHTSEILSARPQGALPRAAALHSRRHTYKVSALRVEGPALALLVRCKMGTLGISVFGLFFGSFFRSGVDFSGLGSIFDDF